MKNIYKILIVSAVASGLSTATALANDAARDDMQDWWTYFTHLAFASLIVSVPLVGLCYFSIDYVDKPSKKLSKARDDDDPFVQDINDFDEA